MQVRALQTLRLGPGTILTLSEQQARDRAHVLAPGADGSFVSTGEVCFKVGEQFGVAVELPKALAQCVDVVSAEISATDIGQPAKPAAKTVRKISGKANPAALNIG
jgi:hypothetical protein